MSAIGVASGSRLLAGAETVAPPGAAGVRLRRVVGWLVAVEVAGDVLWVCWVDNDFATAVAQYGVATSIVLVVNLVLSARRRPGAWWIVVGILVSFLGAGIQQAGLAPHPSFNHNDLYHVVQMAGLWCCIAARGLRVRASARRSAPPAGTVTSRGERYT